MKQNTRITLASLGVALLCSPVMAGSMAQPVEEPQIAPVAPVAPAPSADWTGGYVGAQLGYGDFNASGIGSDDGAIGGLNVGYDYDFGNFVLGGGLDYDWTGVTLGGADVDNIARLRLRGGYDLGGGLIYATAGPARADIAGVGDDTGWFAGIGYEHLLANSFSVGGEVLYHQFDDFNSTGVDVDGSAVYLRGAYRF